MNDMHATGGLHRLDVNLLVAFDTLARERNVTRAAERAGISQSAMSHTLRRLRELFDDPLLVRGRGGMMLTPRAEDLIVPVRSGLSLLVRALEEPGIFEASTARRTFRLASPDLFDALALPRLLRRFGAEAPGVDLAITPTPSRLTESLETGDLDLAITAVLLDDDPVPLGTETAPDLKRRVLFHDSFRCFLRKGHPALAKAKLTLRRYAALGHVLVSPRGDGPGLVDAHLTDNDLSRRVVVRVPQFSSAIAIARESDLALTAPSALAEICDGHLESRPCPVPLPEHAITMVWHPRFTEDPGHRWLRESIAAEFGNRRRGRKSGRR